MNAGDFYVDRLNEIISNIRHFGRTPAQLEQIKLEKERLEKERLEINTKVRANIVLCTRVERRFPRFCRVLTDYFQFVQPSGELASLRYNHYESMAPILASIVKFFRHPTYNDLENKVKKLRDFGFNISSKLLNTDGGKFRTRYSIITGVLLRYSGPYFRNGEIETREIDGTAEVAVALSDGSKKTIELNNVTLDHLGEIIDTIDVLMHSTNMFSSIPVGYGTNQTIPSQIPKIQLSDIETLGTETVEYHLNCKVPPMAMRSAQIKLNSEEITNVKDITNKIFREVQSLAKQRSAN